MGAACMASRNYYQLVVRHPGLHKHRVIRGDDRYIVEAAAQTQMRAWNELYAKKLASEERRRDKDARRQELEDSVAEAEERTLEALAELNAVRGVLAATLRVDDRIEAISKSAVSITCVDEKFMSAFWRASAIDRLSMRLSPTGLYLSMSRLLNVRPKTRCRWSIVTIFGLRGSH